jgi:thymidine phosphorylase
MIATGQALENFRQGIRLQGGDERIIEEPQRLPQARFHHDIVSSISGFITATNCEQFGIALAMLGGGREKKEDSIDPAVGIVLHKKVGDAVAENEPICMLHYNSDVRLSEAESLIYSAYRIGTAKAAAPARLIRRVIEGESKKARA